MPQSQRERVHQPMILRPYFPKSLLVFNQPARLHTVVYESWDIIAGYPQNLLYTSISYMWVCQFFKIKHYYPFANCLSCGLHLFWWTFSEDCYALYFIIFDSCHIPAFFFLGHWRPEELETVNFGFQSISLIFINSKIMFDILY